MSPQWTVVFYEEGFIGPLERRVSELLKSLKNPPAQESDLKALIDQWNEIRNFSAKIARIRANVADPVSELSPARELNGDIIPEYYILREGSWIAYYRIDQDSFLCSGILIRNDAQLAIESLTATLKEVFNRSAGDPGP